METKLIDAIFQFNGYKEVSVSSIENDFTYTEIEAFFSMEGEVSHQ